MFVERSGALKSCGSSLLSDTACLKDSGATASWAAILVLNSPSLCCYIRLEYCPRISKTVANVCRSRLSPVISDASLIDLFRFCDDRETYSIMACCLPSDMGRGTGVPDGTTRR